MKTSYTFSNDRLLAFIKHSFISLGVLEIEIDVQLCEKIFKLAKEKSNFVIQNGKYRTTSSIFRFCANLTALFVYAKPIKTILPCKHKTFTHKDLNQVVKIKDIQNAYLISLFSIYILKDAEFETSNKKVINNIEISSHSLASILYAFSSLNDKSQIPPFILLCSNYYEQLTYKTNFDLQYTDIISY